MSFVPLAVVLRGSFRLDLDVGDAFPYFSPRGEEAWAPGWNPEMLWPTDASWVEGQVFRTGETVWFVASLDRSARRVVYDRVDAGMAAVRVTVSCSPLPAGQTEVAVEYAFVGLTEAGNEEIARHDDATFGKRLSNWREWITAAGARATI